MNRAIKSVLFLLYPLILAVLLIVLSEISYEVVPGGYQSLMDNKIISNTFLSVALAAPFVAMYLFTKSRPFNQWLLWIAFLPAPLPYLVKDALFSPPIYKGLGALLVACFYTAPFVVISLIFAAILTYTDWRRAKKQLSD